MLLSQSANSKCKATNTVLTACTNRPHILFILTSLPNKVHVKNKLLDTNMCFPPFEESSQAATLLWRTADLIQHFFHLNKFKSLESIYTHPISRLWSKAAIWSLFLFGMSQTHLPIFLPVLSYVLVSWRGSSTLFTSSPPWWSIKFMCAIWASIQPASWLASYHRLQPLCLFPHPQSESSLSSSSELGSSSSSELGSPVLGSEIMPSELSISMDVSDM